MTINKQFMAIDKDFNRRVICLTGILTGAQLTITVEKSARNHRQLK